MRRSRRSDGLACHDVTHVTGDYGLREIEAIAERVRRLIPSHRDPERFHIEKSEIEYDLRRLARVLPPPRVTGNSDPGKEVALGVFRPKFSAEKG